MLNFIFSIKDFAVKKFNFKLLITTCCFLALSLQAQAKEESFSQASFDGFKLDGKIESPDNTNPADVKRVVIFIHGSGPQDMDEDLKVATKDKQSNPFFKMVSSALIKKNFATIRYNKRSYQVRQALIADSSYKNNPKFKAFVEHPLSYLVDDVKPFVKLAKQKFPNAAIYLLGHSQGTYIALQNANTDPAIKGTALIGFYSGTMDSILIEQIVYRNQKSFLELDQNGDQKLNHSELRAGSTPIAKALLPQMSILDLNKDQMISLSEYNAGNYTNVLAKDLMGPHYRKEEASYPIVSSIIPKANFKILFLQGMWDNQTPAYNAQAIQILNNVAWKKNNLKFKYYPEVGHALDKRDNYHDIVYRVPTPQILDDIANQIDSFFK